MGGATDVDVYNGTRDDLARFADMSEYLAAAAVNGHRERMDSPGCKGPEWPCWARAR